MPIYNKDIIHAASQTIGVDSGVLIFSSKRGLKLLPTTKPAGNPAGIMVFDTTNTLTYNDGTDWVNIATQDQVTGLADQQNAAHLGTSSSRPLTNEHRYLTSTPTWSVWSDDAFVDFDNDTVLPKKLTFNADVTIYSSIQLNGNTFTNCQQTVAASDIVIKKYIDDMLVGLATPTDADVTDSNETKFFALVSEHTQKMISEVDANRQKLQALWNATQPADTTEKLAEENKIRNIVKALLAAS